MGGIERGEHNLALVNILKIVHTLKLKPSEFFSHLDHLTPATGLHPQNEPAQAPTADAMKATYTYSRAHNDDTGLMAAETVSGYKSTPRD